MKDSKNIVIGLLCAVVCIMAVAYAAFSTTLTINGTATISSNWDVQITAIDCSVTPVEGGATAEGGAANAVTKSFTGTTAQFGMQFYQPGDTGTCTVTITNGGSLPAVVNSITTVVTDATGASENITLTSDAIRYSVEGITEGTKLAAGATNTYTVNAEFYDANEGAAPTTAQLSKTITVTIDYQQDLSA